MEGIIVNFNEEIIEQLIREQRAYYFTGETRDVAFRKEMLQKLADAITDEKYAIIEALYKDLGKSAFEAYTTEVGFVLASIREMIAAVDEWEQPRQVKTPLHLQPAKSFIVKEPYGSVLIIGPFNYPFQLVMEPLIGALVAGNCAVVKPSEFAVETGRVIKTILEKVFPPYYVRVVEGEKEETSILIHAPFDYIFFTGSTAVGKIIMKAAAERLTPITLELGGKSPAIVDQTANLKHAAEKIIWGKCMNAGQTCVAPDYVIVHEDVKDKLIVLLKKAIQQFYGRDVEKSPDYGRIINEQHFDRLHHLLQQSKENIVYGGEVNRAKKFIAPTIVDAVDWQHPLMADELFGPLLPILTYRHLDEVVHDIRKLSKPLSAYFFTENQKAEQYFIEQLPFGGGCINDTVSHVGNSSLPFGGVGASGVNSYHGKASYDLFARDKSMMKRSTKIPMKLVHPPYKNKVQLVKKILK